MTFMVRLRALLHGDGGQDLLEYAMLAGLIAIACVAAVTTAGASLGDMWVTIQTEVAKLAS